MAAGGAMLGLIWLAGVAGGGCDSCDRGRAPAAVKAVVLSTPGQAHVWLGACTTSHQAAALHTRAKSSRRRQRRSRGAQPFAASTTNLLPLRRPFWFVCVCVCVRVCVRVCARARVCARDPSKRTCSCLKLPLPAAPNRATHRPSRALPRQVTQLPGDILLVSQFTLHARFKKPKPDFR